MEESKSNTLKKEKVQLQLKHQRYALGNMQYVDFVESSH